MIPVQAVSLLRSFVPDGRSARFATALTLFTLGAMGLAEVSVAQRTAAGGGRSESQLTVTALIGDSVSDADSPRYSDVNEAIKRFLNRDVLGARQFLEAAKRKNPKLPPIGVMQAKMNALGGNAAGVRPALERSINDEADDPEPYLILAESTFREGRTIEADALFEKASKLIDGYNANGKRKRQLTIRAYRGLAAVAERRENWAAAEADLRVWLREDPENAGARTRLGRVLCMLDRVDEGRQEFVKATDLAKSNGESTTSPFVLTAMMFERRGMQTEAIAEFRKAYRENTKDETTLVAFAQSLLRSGDLQTAGRVLDAARKAAPESFSVWLLSGVTYRMVGDATKAEQALMKALSLSPDSREAYNQIAQLLAEQDDEAKQARSVKYALANTKINPNDTDAAVTLSWALFQSGRKQEGLLALQRALQQSGGAVSADSQVLVAKMMIANNQLDNARSILTRALKPNQGVFVQRAAAEKLLESLN